jgi:hypothetical protein
VRWTGPSKKLPLCRRVPRLVLIAVVLGLPGTLGCNQTQAPGLDSDEGRIGVLVCDVNDARTEPKQLARYFAPEARPDRQFLAKLKKHAIAEVGKATVTGDQATTKILVHDATTGKNVGTVEWTFVKQGDTWKVKSTSLP